ncbi:MAG TPA: tripartite tricarboxylate transporter substrate binding protein [Eoetvoesiella sp.]
MRLEKIAAIACISLATSLNVQAAEYPEPNHPIRIIHGYAAGGNADIISRVVGQAMTPGMGVPFAIEAKPGAGGLIAAQTVARAAPDGYTLITLLGGHSVKGALSDNLGFDPVDSFSMISTIMNFPFLIMVKADSPYKTIQDLNKAMKTKKEALSYGSAGVGTTQHLTGEIMSSQGGVKLLHVPYRGGAAAMTSLLGNEIDFVIDTATIAVPQVKAGAIRVLAVTSNTRWSGMPDVPTLAESGYDGFNVSSWAGLAGPANMPPAIVKRLNTELQKALSTDAAKTQLKTMGGDIATGTPNDMKERISGEIQKYRKVAKEKNIPRL